MALIYSHQLKPDIHLLHALPGFLLLTVEDPFMQKLVELITENAQDPELSMEVLYNKLGMSRTQFFRKIKAISDLSPNKLILNIRMKMAVEKFQSGGMTIAEIAYEVGFSFRLTLVRFLNLYSIKLLPNISRILVNNRSQV